MNIDAISSMSTKSKKLQNFRKLRISLKYRPEIFKLIVKLHLCIRKKTKLIRRLKKDLEKIKKGESKTSQVDEIKTDSKIEVLQDNAAWNCDTKDSEKSIADQVKEAAQSALDQSGMVYVESAGMYYDYKTGYYYNSELGLYYHTDTSCYYYYSDEKKTFEFHSYPDISKINRQQKTHDVYQKKQAKKHKKEKEDGNEEAIKTKRKKRLESKSKGKSDPKHVEKNDNDTVMETDEVVEQSKIIIEENGLLETKAEKITLGNVKNKGNKTAEDLEEGECSSSENELCDNESVASTATASDDDDDETVAKHHPPCMRVIVRETNLPKLKVGTLFLVTKDGGTIGREGEEHTILLKDQNVSRIHLDLQYDSNMNCYMAMDLGSKNGTILNGHRMSESQETSSSMAIRHGSVLQLGETKLLCHIHPGNDTCGHCEPGLVMEAENKEKQAAYTRTCSVQKQYQLELARLKNKYVPEVLAIEEGSYNDRAKARREAMGSTHHAEKTQQTDLDTSIAADNKGFKILEKMGWSKGEGLGKDNQGHTEPIPLVKNESKVGLGAVGSAEPVSLPVAGRHPLRLATRSKLLRPPAKAFRDPLEEDDD